MSGSGDARFRPDLEGLRGLAILLVLLCHAGIPGFWAGFVGVDVFFVLSGFLITGLLVDERERTGRIHLGAFYARRARRILPAAVVVLASTLLAAQFILSPLDLPRVTTDVLAAGLSVANIRFALEATDYFAPVAASPVLHYWSLSVEEQFYLLWPALLLIASRVRRPRRAMTLLVIAVLGTSFMLSIEVTTASGPWAYYSLPTRAWQLAAGGLLALAIPLLSRIPRRLAAVLGWLGVGALGVGLAVIGPTTDYPGMGSLLPTLGAVAVVASGGLAGSPGWLLLARAPVRWLGRISYSLYLWHWPILILGPAALGLTSSPDGLAGGDLALRLGLVVVAVVIAALSWRLVEEPFRNRHRSPTNGRRILAGALRGFALAGTAILVVGVASTTMGSTVHSDRDEAAAAVDGEGSPDGSGSADPGATIRPPGSTIVRIPGSVPDPDTFPGQQSSATPLASPGPAPRPSPQIRGHVPRDLQPSLEAARTDGDPLIADGCGLSLAGSNPPSCVYGDPGGTMTVALVGDSHASHWFPALEIIARERGWRLIPLTKHSCVFVDMPLWSPYLEREYTECEAWREKVVARLVELKPDLVIVSSARWFPVISDRDNDSVRQGVAMARLIERIPGKVAIIVDTPWSDVDVPACIAQYPSAIQRCTTPRSAAFTTRHLRRETEAARLTGSTIVDLSDAICPTDPCPPIIGTILVYRDHHHLTATFAASLAADLEAALPIDGWP